MAEPRISLTDAITRWLKIDRSKDPEFKDRVNYLVRLLGEDKLTKDGHKKKRLLDLGWEREASGAQGSRKGHMNLPRDQQTRLRNALSLLGVLGKPANVLELLRPSEQHPGDPNRHRRDKAWELKAQLELYGWLDDALKEFLERLASTDPLQSELPNPFGDRLPQHILKAGSLAEQLQRQPAPSAADRMVRHALRNELELAWKEAQGIDPQCLSPEQKRIHQQVIARYEDAIAFDNLLNRWL